MKLKKKVILMANMMLCAVLLVACGKEEENQKDSKEKWEVAYKEVVRNMESYLADPYIFRQEPDWVNSDSCIGYIGIHDFDGDSVPELTEEIMLPLSSYILHGLLKRGMISFNE